MQESLHALLCLVFAVVAVDVVYETYLLRETSRMLRIVIWPMQSVIPLAFFVGFVRHALYAVFPEIRPGENSDMITRSEERRVGKECRCRGEAGRYENK